MKATWERIRQIGRKCALAGVMLALGGMPTLAQTHSDGRRVSDDWCGTGTGGLHVVQDGRTVERDFPLKHTKVQAEVTGPVTRVVVTQTFTNPYEDTIEAVYVFPLPHEAAVTDLTMRLGERVIRGAIDRRDEARRLYENARDAGKVAALLEQERPNIFTQSVANILPGNDVEISLEYVEMLDYDAGAYEFVFPMVVGPRFIPPGGGGDMVPASTRCGFAPAPGVSDADRITPPYLPPSVRSGHDIELSLSWDAGIGIDDVTSPSHRIDLERPHKTRAQVRLHANDSIPNKDFVVRCSLRGDGPQTGVLAHHDGESGYLTLLLHPELEPSAADVTAKEMIFVVDCSGSMSGEPIAAAKALVRRALRQVNAGDSFQIIRFSSRASQFASTPIPATPENVRRGIAYIDQLSGGGGTMMIEGIRAALDFPEDPDRLRLVMFLTDGYIGNENDILSEVRDRIGSARIFSFGVGSSVNRFLLDGLAQEGRGEVQYVLPGSSAQAEAARFYERIRNPYLTDIEIIWDGLAVEDAQPRRIPDLFAGRPLAIHARYDDGGRGAVEVRGRIAGRKWTRRLPVRLPTSPAGSPAIGSLWARAKIAGLEREMLRGESPRLVNEITQLGLTHRLVTKYTSFVAVEEQLVVSNGQPRTVRVPLTMPEGVSFEGTFGDGFGFRPNSGDSKARSAEQLGALSYRSPATPGRVLKEDSIADRPSSRPAGERERDALVREEMARTVLVMVSAPTFVAAGDPVELTITVTNRGRYAIDVPAVAGLRALRLRVVDGAWREFTFGAGGAAAATQSIPAGATVTLTWELKPADAAFLAVPGTYHLVLEGTPFGAADAERITLRVGPAS